jgi:hypothetical protein
MKRTTRGRCGVVWSRHDGTGELGSRVVGQCTKRGLARGMGRSCVSGSVGRALEVVLVDVDADERETREEVDEAEFGVLR